MRYCGIRLILFLLLATGGLYRRRVLSVTRVVYPIGARLKALAEDAAVLPSLDA